jgi:hypothetical protein
MKNIYQSNRFRYAALLMVFVLLSANVYGQSKKTWQLRKSAKQTAAVREQTSFSSESKISNLVKLPANILKRLSEYENGRLAECQRDTDVRKQNAAEHFAASKINLNGDGRQDLLVQAQTGCFMGAHNTTFWLFVDVNQKSNAGYKLIFDTAVDSLRVLRTSANGYRDIETASHTAVELYTIKWKFDGRKYVKSECRLTDENNKTSKIKCNF